LTVIVHLSAALARRGHQVEVWRLHDWASGPYEDQRTILDSDGVTQVSIGRAPVWRLGGVVERHSRGRQIDLVHLHGAFNPSNTAISRALGGPYVFSPHSGYDPVSLRRSRGRKLLYRLLFERTMAERAASVVALTDVERRQIEDFGAKGPVAVIPNGVAAPSRDVDRLAFRRELGLPDQARLAAFVGRLDVYRKGLDLVAEGIADAPNWHLALVGPRFRDVARLERIISDLAIRERVHFTDERHGRKLQEALAGADLFVLMSRWEGLPMALLEAMSYGTPVVVSPAVSSLIDVEAAEAGWVAQSGGLGAILRQREKDGSQELETRGQAAREFAKRYDWNSVAELYELVYEQARRPQEPVR
jgi:glycosyltransferase involved in cell wall biosynthesis